MDKYVKMCSLLSELQDLARSKGKGYINTPLDTYWIDGNTAIIKPSLEQLVTLLEYRFFNLECFKYPDNPDIYVCEADTTNGHGSGGTPKIAILKLVAFELWGKIWNDEKEVWIDG